MAVLSGTYQGHTVLHSDKDTHTQVVLIAFTANGTYAQADNGILSGIPTLIANARRDGSSYTLVSAAAGPPTLKEGTKTTMGLKTVAVSTNDVTFEITDNDFTTELANGAVPAHGAFSIVCLLKEAVY